LTSQRAAEAGNRIDAEAKMDDHRAILDQYLRTRVPGAALKDDHDPERHGHRWSIKLDDQIMMLRVSQEFLTAGSEDAARVILTDLVLCELLSSCLFSRRSARRPGPCYGRIDQT
jgi:hypothetical protein